MLVAERRSKGSSETEKLRATWEKIPLIKKTDPREMLKKLLDTTLPENTSGE